MMHSRVLTLCLLLLVLVSGLTTAHGAQRYVLTVQNQLVNGTGFSFDIYMRRTEDPIDLGDCDMYLTFNVANFGSPATSAASALSGYVMGAVFIAPNRVVLNITSPMSGPFAVPVSDAKVGTITLTTITNPNGLAGLGWVRISPTLVQNYLGDDITGLGTYENPGDVPLPVTLKSFDATVNPSGPGVRLRWTTVSEVNNYGFYVQRKAEGDSVYVELENSFVGGHGTTLEPHEYGYVDLTVRKAGTYYYRLRQVDLDGTEHYTAGVGVALVASLTSVMETAPMEFQLVQNYPNPFNPVTKIRFSVEKPDRAVLKVYSIAGQELATLFDDVAEPGRYYSVKLDGSGLASGLYFYRLLSGKHVEMRKMLLVK